MKTVEIKLSKTVKGDNGKNVRQATGVTLAVPVFTSEELQAHSAEAAAWVEQAIEAATLAKARNAGTQAEVATTIESLIAVAQRSGEALKLFAAFGKDFAEFLAKHASDKKQAVRDTLVAMARNKNILATSNEVRKQALAAQLEAFAEAMTEDQAEAYIGIMENLISLCNGEAVEDADFE